MEIDTYNNLDKLTDISILIYWMYMLY
jgi:hypothetical protein